jgi:hypothetical protein
MARSSQPNVGLLAWRLNEDEMLLKAIADCCANSSKHAMKHSKNYKSETDTSSSLSNNQTNNATTTTTTNSTNVNSSSSTNTISNTATNTNNNNLPPQPQPVLLIIDARFRSVALANRVKGGGYEYSEYYTNCEIQFMNLENIHVIRSSFQSLRSLCQTFVDNKTFLSQLESTKWLHHLSGIIKAACTVTSAIDQLGKPVLIHCSDGWDRTPQILGLAKLLLDPYYRTLDGFKTLIDMDWLAFGHKFAQRNGHSNSYNDINERCPVFLQWLDCVYQIMRQFPSAFQFNELCLLKLCYHSYSCLFGTFLCDSSIERFMQHTEERTFSVWSYLNEKNPDVVNHLYDDTYDEILYPNYELVNLVLWQRLFCESDITYLIKTEIKHEIQNFNDSIDGGACFYGGSSPPPPSSLNENDSQINSLLKNAIIELPNNNSINSKSLNKSRSYDDLSTPISLKINPKFNNNAEAVQDEPVLSNNNNLTLDNNNHDPIQVIRSNSESNLLLDALKTASPKSINNVNFNFNNLNLNSNSNIIVNNNNGLHVENSGDLTNNTLVINSSSSSNCNIGVQNNDNLVNQGKFRIFFLKK